MKRITLFTIFLCTIILSSINYSQNIEWVSVPSGSFTYGENDEIRSIDSDYEIMKYEVTNAQFLTYLKAALVSEDITVAGDGVYGFYDGDSLWSAGTYEFYDTDD
ncbi:MAG: hypothetical protein HND52_16500 [Ignavibacteriae bacterium]|nr:hypothetical protein [Ignavibacteriota bacterium]NOG99559.1 hypothetical protein [Ignavibacteriota bacterium]